MATTSRQARREMDRISSLPDEPLCHILSFLQTQEAAATSVLSKRWRHLWTSVPTLDFDFDEKIYSNMGRPSYCFEKFIYATILARDARQPIRSFRLKYEAEAYCRNADVNVWVNTVLQRGIENLHLWMSKFCRRNNVLRIVSCKTLVVLKLRGLRVYASSPVELPSLKSLHLEHVEFRKRQSILELVRGCPIIEI
uniref:F-box domain-containing protein n=1 Tax=Lotus japonicus TaxID=34305 RepID=I3S957_LOTJA|nr:unknown [Lotus japonicus]